MRDREQPIWVVVLNGEAITNPSTYAICERFMAEEEFVLDPTTNRVSRIANARIVKVNKPDIRSA